MKFLKRIFGSCEDGIHRFEGRYDQRQPEWMGRISEIKCSPSMINRLYERHYVRDVCVRCGKTIERDDGAEDIRPLIGPASREAA